MLLVGLVCAVAVAAVGLGWVIEKRSPSDIEAPRGFIDIGVSPGSAILDLSDEQLASDLDRLVAIGARWIRVDVDWSRIEPLEGEYTWETTDRVVAAAAERELQVIGLVTYTPSWVRPPDTTSKHPPLDVDAFARFAHEAAVRYAGLVKTWEVWNEPNSGLFWEEGPDPAGYAQLLTATSSGLRAADPDIIILSGGLAPAQDAPGKEMSPQRFLQEMFDALAPGVIDAVGIHPYSFPADPGDSSKDWNLFAQLPEIHQLITRAEGRPLDLWLTEFGAPFDIADPSRQAEIITAGLICAGRWSWTGPVLIYALRDADSDPGDLEFGLFAHDGEARPAALEVERLSRLDAGTPTTSPCPVSDP